MSEVRVEQIDPRSAPENLEEARTKALHQFADATEQFGEKEDESKRQWLIGIIQARHLDLKNGNVFINTHQRAKRIFDELMEEYCQVLSQTAKTIQRPSEITEAITSCQSFLNESYQQKKASFLRTMRELLPNVPTELIEQYLSNNWTLWRTAFRQQERRFEDFMQKHLDLQKLMEKIELIEKSHECNEKGMKEWKETVDAQLGHLEGKSSVGGQDDGERQDNPHMQALNVEKETTSNDKSHNEQLLQSLIIRLEALERRVDENEPTPRRKQTDQWITVRHGSDFPPNAVRALGRQLRGGNLSTRNSYVALWHADNGEAAFGRAWNDNGVVEAFFPWGSIEQQSLHLDEFRILVNPHAIPYCWLKPAEIARSGYKPVELNGYSPAVVTPKRARLKEKVVQPGWEMLGKACIRARVAFTTYDGHEIDHRDSEFDDCLVLVREK